MFTFPNDDTSNDAKTKESQLTVINIWNYDDKTWLTITINYNGEHKYIHPMERVRAVIKYNKLRSFAEYKYYYVDGSLSIRVPLIVISKIELNQDMKFRAYDEWIEFTDRKDLIVEAISNYEVRYRININKALAYGFG